MGHRKIEDVEQQLMQKFCHHFRFLAAAICWAKHCRWLMVATALVKVYRPPKCVFRVEKCIKLRGTLQKQELKS